MYFKKLVRKGMGVLNPINKVLPKKEKRIVFYSNLGFRDNVKAVYDFVIQTGLNKDYQLICACNDYKEYLNNQIKNVIFVSPEKGLIFFLTSKYFFYSFGKYPVKPSKNQMVVNLFHGTPLKTIGALNKNESHERQDYFTCVLAASPYFVPIMAQSFGVIEERVAICGHARNDKLFDDNTKMQEYFKTGQYRRVFFWLPTFRKQAGNKADSTQHAETKLSIFTDWDSLQQLNKRLSELQSLCIIKLHPLQEWNQEKNVSFSNILFFTHQSFIKENLDLYEVLPIADVLITDYSSVYFDYLLLDRPIGFTVDDIESYQNTRGFVFDNPLEYMPGPKITNKEMFLQFLESCCNDQDDYKQERQKINDLCNYYQDGNNAKRALHLAGIL